MAWGSDGSNTWSSGSHLGDPEYASGLFTYRGWGSTGAWFLESPGLQEGLSGSVGHGGPSALPVAFPELVPARCLWPKNLATLVTPGSQDLGAYQ